MIMKLDFVKRLLLAFTLNLTLCASLSAQRTKVTALPVLYFTPETNFAFGGLVNANFYLQDTTFRPSFALIGGAYTLNKQILAYLPFEFNWGENRHIFGGELGYYRYFYNYYGIGPDASDDLEIYTVNFPRFILNYAHRFYGFNYLGVNYRFDNYAIQELDPEGSLLNDDIPGAAGSRISMFGISYAYDTRNNLYNPSKGWFFSLRAEFNKKFSGSDFNYQRLIFDASHYMKVNPKGIVALNLYGGTMRGEAPFQELLLYGGPRKARGYFEGRFRDKNLLLFQVEYRYNFYKRFGLVVFGTLGNVSPRFFELELLSPKYNYGLGLRYMINTADLLNIRLDYAWGKNSTGLYITFAEAF